MAYVRAKVSTVVKDQVPEFIKDENANFTKFLEAYYEWLETEFVEESALENIRSVDDTVDMFINYFERELLHPIPKSVIADKRLLMKHIKGIYGSKGTTKSYEFLFRILFGQEPQIYFPKVDMLRVSDGKWDQRKLMRVTEVTGDPNELIGQTIEQILRYPDGSETRAAGRVESMVQFAVGNKQIYQIVLSDDSLDGVPFVAEDTENVYQIEGISTISGNTIVCNVVSIITEIRVDAGGSYYSIGDEVQIQSGTGIEARAEVAELGFGSVSDVIITKTGSGYEVGDEVIFDNTDTGGPATAESARVIARVTEVDRDSIVMEDGGFLLQENLDQIDNELSDAGGLKKITVLNSGNFYNKLPTASLPTQGLRTGGEVRPVSTDIARITKVIVPDNGTNYLTPPLVKPPLYMVVKNLTAPIAGGEIVSLLPQSLMLEEQTQVPDSNTIESGLIFEDATVNDVGDPIGGMPIFTEKQQVAIGLVANIDADRGIIQLTNANTREGIILEDGSGALLDEDTDQFVQETSGFFSVRNKIIATNGAEASIISINEPALVSSVGAIANSIGGFINSDGKVSESSKKIQDSFYYQDYSYVIKIGESINFYRDAVKKFLHPIGLALFGEVQIQSLIQAKVAGADGVVLGPGGLPLKASMLRHVVNTLLNARMRAVGRYRTNDEDNQALYKLQTIISIEDFVASALNIHVSASEFLPVLKFPHLTPLEISLLDLHVDVASEQYKVIWEKLVTQSPTFRESLKEIEKQSNMPFDGTVRRAGPNLIDIERWKFTHRPHQAGDKQSASAVAYTTNKYDNNPAQYPAPNYTYWDSYANTQIKDFGHLSVSEVLNNPYRKVNYAIEAEIGIIKKPASALRFSTDDFRFTWDDTFKFDADSVGWGDDVYTLDNAKLTFDLYT